MVPFAVPALSARSTVSRSAPALASPESGLLYRWPASQRSKQPNCRQAIPGGERADGIAVATSERGCDPGGGVGLRAGPPLNVRKCAVIGWAMDVGKGPRGG